MRTFNLTGLACSRFVVAEARPDDTLVFVVKGTADIAPDGPMALRPAPEQQRPCLDRRDPEGERDEIRYPSDFVPRKDGADILLHGRAWAPGGRPVPAVEAAVTMGNRRWAVTAHGERAWRRGADGRMAPGPAQPFLSLPLAWRHARGGLSAPPRLEALGRPAIDGAALPPPVAPAPLPRRPAQPLAGNAAPPDWRLDGFLRGDERLRLSHLHPEHPALDTALPGLRLRVFVNRLDAAAGRSPTRAERGRVHRLIEVDMALDTLWLAPDEGTGILVWRGRIAIASRRCTELLHALVVAESLERPPLPEAHYARLLAELLLQARPRPISEIRARAVADAEIRESMAKAKEALDRTALPADVIARLKAEDDPLRFLQIIAAAAEAQYGSPSEHGDPRGSADGRN